MLIQAKIVNFIEEGIKNKNFHIHGIGNAVNIHWEDVTEGQYENYDINICITIPKTEDELQKEYNEKLEYFCNPLDYIERYKTIKSFPFFRNGTELVGYGKFHTYTEDECREKALDIVKFILDEVLQGK